MKKVAYKQKNLSFEGYSIAGKGSSLRLLGKKIMFDYGVHDSKFSDTKYLFLSHIHADHMVGLFPFLLERMKLPPLPVFVPENNAQQLTDMLDKFCTLTACPNTYVIVPVKPGQHLELEDNLHVLVRSVHHLAPDAKDSHIESVAYTLYETRQKLQPQFQGKKAAELANITASGVSVMENKEVNLLTYVGDSMVDTYRLAENADIPDSSVVFLESTHIGLDNESLAKARYYGHTDLLELKETIGQYVRRNPNVQIVLKHFSNKYKLETITAAVNAAFPDNVHVFASNE